MISVIRRIIKIIGDVTCVLAAVVLVAVAVMIFAHIRPAVIVSGSMEPVMHTGSIAFIDSDYSGSDLRERDIIAFETGGVIVTHRLVRITDEGYVTKGDANEDEDPGLVSEADIIGRVVMWLPWLGYIVRTTGSPAGITAAVSFYLMLLLLYRLTGKEVETDDRKKSADCSGCPPA